MTRTINDIQKFARIAREELLKCDENLIANDFIRVVLNPRLSRALARCRTEYDSLGYISNQVIEVQSDYYFSNKVSDHEIIGTLMHEFLHSLFPHDHHEGQWKKWADFISMHSDYKISRVSDDLGWYRNDYSDFKYAIVCPTCNKVLKLYKSKSKQVLHPHDYRHRPCHTLCESRLVTSELLESLNVKQKTKPVHPEQLSLF
jgi:hypothetical protein